MKRLRLIAESVCLTAVLFTFGLVGSSFAQSDKLSLPFLIGSKQVLVIGESYGRPESPEFLSKTVSEYLNGGGCLKVGLEISSDQQETLDSAVKGQVPVSDMRINDIIDSPAYRQMLADLGAQIRAGKCLSVHAIDAPASVPVSRDAWMEKEVVAIAGDTPVVLLVGNVRAVKDSGSGEDDTSRLLAERLQSETSGVASALQYWEPGQCGNRTVEYVSASDEKAGIYLKETVSGISAQMPEQPTAIADGVLVWSCETTKITESIDIQNDNVIEDKFKIDEEKTDVVVRDEKALKRIRWGIKNKYPAFGMTKDEAVQALGEPDDIKETGASEEWSYQCFDEDGYYLKCFVLTFKAGVVVKYEDLQ